MSRLHRVGSTFILVAVAALASCATTPPLRRERGTWVQEGKATWYGREADGGPTASGERFNMLALTAAHRSLPFNTRVEVTNLSNGHQIIVRINDRGPYGRGRVIDVSFAAARALRMLNDGVVRVRLRVLR